MLVQAEREHRRQQREQQRAQPGAVPTRPAVATARGEVRGASTRQVDAASQGMQHVDRVAQQQDRVAAFAAHAQPSARERQAQRTHVQRRHWQAQAAATALHVQRALA